MLPILLLQLLFACVVSRTIVRRANVESAMEKGRHYVNEFQLLKPSNIALGNFKGNSKFFSSLELNRRNNLNNDGQSSGEYHFVSISPLIIANNDIVTVTFNSTNPDENDWIAAYSPASSVNNISSTAPMKYGFCDESVDYLTTGIGTLKFNLTNI